MARLSPTSLAAQRGYFPLYRHGTGQACPSCSGSNWHVGRSHAECGFCSAVLPIAEPFQPPEKAITNVQPKRPQR